MLQVLFKLNKLCLLHGDCKVLEGAIRVGSTVGQHSYPNHLDTGLTGTYFMTKVLMESGRNDLVFAYANQTTFPSYANT